MQVGGGREGEYDWGVQLLWSASQPKKVPESSPLNGWGKNEGTGTVFPTAKEQQTERCMDYALQQWKRRAGAGALDFNHTTVIIISGSSWMLARPGLALYSTWEHWFVLLASFHNAPALCFATWASLSSRVHVYFIWYWHQLFKIFSRPLQEAIKKGEVKILMKQINF